MKLLPLVLATLVATSASAFAKPRAHAESSGVLQADENGCYQLGEVESSDPVVLTFRGQLREGQTGLVSQLGGASTAVSGFTYSHDNGADNLVVSVSGEEVSAQVTLRPTTVNSLKEYGKATVCGLYVNSSVADGELTMSSPLLGVGQSLTGLSI